MQVALTKKLADAMAVKPVAVVEELNPLFSWTANWINTFSNRKEDMVVMVNNATRFTVIIYGIRRNQFQNIAQKMEAAILQTLLHLRVNQEVIAAYLEQAGAISFCANHDRQRTSWVNRQGMDAALIIGAKFNESPSKIQYQDTWGLMVNERINKWDGEYFSPREKFFPCLEALTGKPVYQYRAFELLVTLNLEVYQATRRIIVPTDLEFSQLHQVLQKVYNWRNSHLYEFVVLGEDGQATVARLVTSAEELEYDPHARLLEGCKLSDFLPASKGMRYTYDMGDNWVHEIALVREIANHNQESPYLLEAEGQAPPEDVGGIGGFVNFRNIMLDPQRPEYRETLEWAGYWSPELSAWESHSGVICI